MLDKKVNPVLPKGVQLGLGQDTEVFLRQLLQNRNLACAWASSCLNKFKLGLLFPVKINHTAPEYKDFFLTFPTFEKGRSTYGCNGQMFTKKVLAG